MESRLDKLKEKVMSSPSHLRQEFKLSLLKQIQLKRIELKISSMPFQIITPIAFMVGIIATEINFSLGITTIIFSLISFVNLLFIYAYWNRQVRNLENLYAEIEWSEDNDTKKL